MIQQYSRVYQGDVKLSDHFKVRELACLDGTDIILVDTRLVEILESLRVHFGRPVFIRSGYRTLAYNNQIGGARGSHHIRGQAADIDIGRDDTLVNPLLVAMTAQALGSTRIGCYRYSTGSSWVHVGSAPGSSYWTQARPDEQIKIDTFLPVLRRQLIPVKSEFCAIMQQILFSRLGLSYTVDGKFGAQTLKALLAYQQQSGLIPDGICGINTWTKLLLSRK